MVDLAELPTIEELKLEIKKTVKDSVFRDIFSDKKYALRLYRAIHPEDVDVTEDDIENVTINNVISDQLYNDLGMTVRGTLLILLEAQSTWSINIIVRILLYLAHTWHRYIEETKQNRYGSKKLKLPKPEFYVIYTGERKDMPDWIRLSEEFFDKNSDFLEVSVRVLYGQEGKKDIITQYVDFTKVYTEQVGLYGRTEKAVFETIRICKDRNVLKEYLESREKEVFNIMMSLFDQEKISEMYGRDMKEEGRAEGRTEAKKEFVLTMKDKGFSNSVIADIMNVGINTISQWVSEEKTPVL